MGSMPTGELDDDAARGSEAGFISSVFCRATGSSIRAVPAADTACADDGLADAGCLAVTRWETGAASGGLGANCERSLPLGRRTWSGTSLRYLSRQTRRAAAKSPMVAKRCRATFAIARWTSCAT